jgi:AAA family ATP:ADP antiporter
MIVPLIRRFVDIRSDDELRGLLWGTAYGFLIMLSYYILRAVRDEISAADRGNLQILWTAVFLVMLLAVPFYSWIASRLSRGVFVPLANRFFITCLVVFWLGLALLPETARPWIDRVFYVWTSVFALFVVTIFWGFMADCFDNSQGKRLFAFIAVGSSVGGMLGSALTATLAGLLPTFSLLLIACLPLEAASWCASALHRRFGTGNVRADGEAERAIRGTAWSGMQAVFSSPYLLGIAAFIALMTFVSTILYFQQAYLVADAFADRGERTAFFARIDLVVNILTVAMQVYLTARIVKWLGVGLALALVPIAMMLGFLALGLYPTLAVLVVVQVLTAAVTWSAVGSMRVWLRSACRSERSLGWRRRSPACGLCWASDWVEVRRYRLCGRRAHEDADAKTMSEAGLGGRRPGSVRGLAGCRGRRAVGRRSPQHDRDPIDGRTAPGSRPRYGRLQGGPGGRRGAGPETDPGDIQPARWPRVGHLTELWQFRERAGRVAGRTRHSRPGVHGDQGRS